VSEKCRLILGEPSGKSSSLTPDSSHLAARNDKNPIRVFAHAKTLARVAGSAEFLSGVTSPGSQNGPAAGHARRGLSVDRQCVPFFLLLKGVFARCFGFA
jgi:hypothetical protein